MVSGDTVLRAFVAHEEELPAWAAFETLADLLSAQTASPLNPATVRSALRHGGYDPKVGEN
jgi:hypothetical protein